MTELDRLLPFTAHNIERPDGSRTVPENHLLLADEPRLIATLRTLDLLSMPGEQLRIVDLGCLEGGYSIEFARLGHEVLGIDARHLNIERARAAQSELELDNVQFVVDDVHNLEAYGTFDIVFCCGLLYHLDAPISYLHVLGRVAGRGLILNTHYSRKDDPRYDDPNGAGNSPLDKEDYMLSQLDQNEGVPGRWYREHDEHTSDSEMQNRLWASYGNERSFWPTKRALLHGCQLAGFDTVYEQHDVVDDIADDLAPDRHDRAQIVGVKSTWSLNRSSRVITHTSKTLHRAARLARGVRAGSLRF